MQTDRNSELEHGMLAGNSKPELQRKSKISTRVTKGLKAGN